MLSTFLPFYLLPPVTKFRGVFGGRKLFLPGHSGLIFDGRVETCFYYHFSCGLLEVTGSHGKGRNVFLPHHSHTPIETKMRQDKKVER
jgi:hypothetical protein